MYCTRSIVIPGTGTYPSVPVFICLNTDEISFCHPDGISIDLPLQLERFLNSLGKGVFSVTDNGAVEGIEITTDCNNIEFLTAGISHSGGDVTIDFEDPEDCTETPCEPCENECLQGLIGLRDVCVPKDSTNCVWIDEIGINRHTIEQVLTKNYSSVSDFFDKQYNNAIKEVSNVIHTQFSSKYIINSLIESMRLGFANDNKIVKTSNSKLSGIQLSFLNANSFVDLYISELSLFTDFTGTVTIKVYDLLTSKQISSFNINTVAGEQSYIHPNKIFKSNRKKLNLFICYDTTGINSYTTVIKNGLCCGINHCSNQYLEASGNYSDTDLFIDRDVKQATHTFGMSLVYSLQCNHTDWVCASKNILALPIAYKLAANICKYGLTAASDQRVNNFVTIQKEQLTTDQAWYEGKFSERMNNILLHIQTPDDRKCFQCTQPGGTVLNLP